MQPLLTQWSVKAAVFLHSLPEDTDQNQTRFPRPLSRVQIFATLVKKKSPPSSRLKGYCLKGPSPLKLFSFELLFLVHSLVACDAQQIIRFIVLLFWPIKKKIGDNSHTISMDLPQCKICFVDQEEVSVSVVLCHDAQCQRSPWLFDTSYLLYLEWFVVDHPSYFLCWQITTVCQKGLCLWLVWIKSSVDLKTVHSLTHNASRTGYLPANAN